MALITIFDAAALGARSIHATLLSCGYSCDLILFRDKRDRDGTWPSDREYELLGELLKSRKPDVLGISLRSFALGIANRLTEEARKAIDPLIVWGGTHPTLLPEECINTADVVCVGEGEGAMLDLMEALSSGKSINEISNLWVRDGQNIHRNSLRPLIQDLDALPFPVLGNENKFSIEHDQLLSEDVYLGGEKLGSYYISASRGCPFHCDFCCNSAFHEVFKGLGPYLRKRSPENVIQELERAVKNLEVKFVAFMDEVFSLDKQWTREVCEIYGRTIGIPFKCEVHPNTCDAELVADMKAAGLKLAVLGVQSGSDRSRRENYNRITTNEAILRTAELFHRYKVLVYYDMIFDNPYETEQDLSETMDLLLKLPRPHNLEIFSLCYFPRTRITERALADGLITRDQVEDRSFKTFAQFWSSTENSINKENAFYTTLAWIELLKFHPESMSLIYLAGSFGDSFHVVPQRALRWLSRAKFLKRHPKLIFYAISPGIKWANRALVPLRLLSSTIKLLLQGRWREIPGRVKERLAPPF